MSACSALPHFALSWIKKNFFFSFFVLGTIVYVESGRGLLEGYAQSWRKATCHIQGLLQHEKLEAVGPFDQQ